MSAVFSHDRELALLRIPYQFAGAFPEITDSEGFHGHSKMCRQMMAHSIILR